MHNTAIAALAACFLRVLLPTLGLQQLVQCAEGFANTRVLHLYGVLPNLLSCIFVFTFICVCVFGFLLCPLSRGRKCSAVSLLRNLVCIAHVLDSD